MTYGLVQTVAAADLLTAAEALTHAHVDTADDDGLTLGRIRAATRWAEDFTGRAFVTQTWKLVLDWFPGEIMLAASTRWLIDALTIRMPKAPLQSVTSIQYTDIAGVLQSLDASLYQVGTQTEPGRLAPAWGKVWPVTRLQLEAVVITFVCGYGAASAIPDGIREAVKQMVALWIRNREPVVTAGGIPKEVALMGEALLWPFWVGEYLPMPGGDNYGGPGRW